ncbi:hypothetical protein ABZT49_03815 [Methylobacterium sp. EM32]|uniref:hypothetical protein n=1 Tax=Methylobacterium sp. EM32 TaxID=3163481 RepID=UPI0033A85E10
MSIQGLAYVLVVTDGMSLRTIHPAALGEGDARAVEDVVRRHVLEPAPGPIMSEPRQEMPGDRIRRAALVEVARASGFTGDLCDRCGNMQMKRSGACLTCQACGATTGCA